MLIDDFEASRQAAGTTDATLDGYRAAWAELARWYEAANARAPDPAALTSLDLAEWRRSLAARLQPSSVNTRLRQLKAILAWAVHEGVIAENPARNLRPVPQEEGPVKTLSRKTMAALLREARRDGRTRDYALMTVLAQTGLRIDEALALTWEDIKIGERSGSVTVRHGKGGKRRTVPLTLTARQALIEWRTAQGDGAERVFPVGARAVQKALHRYSRRAGLEDRVTPHMFRHTFCKALVDAGESLDRVAALAGHARLDTTARYTKPTVTDLEKAVAKLEWI